MILTPIERKRLPTVLECFAARLASPESRAAFRRLAQPEWAERATGAEAARHHCAALRALARLGIPVVAAPPARGFNWDGRAVWSGTEAYVLLHEAAHFQLAAPRRRQLVDFGLGPGPETGERRAAERAVNLTFLAREREEAHASLLGILWEAELGQPALASFLDQNWLEGPERPATIAHFESVAAALHAQGFITTAGRPTATLRSWPDAAIDLLASGERAVRSGEMDVNGKAAMIDRGLPAAEPPLAP